MVAIRLSRTGAKKKPSYRVVVIDSRRARDSRNIEIVGHYNPRPDPIEVVLKRDRIDYWVSVGAQLSDTVKRLVKQFDKRLAEEATNGVPTQASSPVEQAPEPAAEQAVDSTASAPGAPVPAAPGEELDEDLDVAEALLELEGAVGEPAAPAEEVEPGPAPESSEAAAEAEAVEPVPEAPDAEEAETEPVAEPAAEPVADTEDGAEDSVEPPAEPAGEDVASESLPAAAKPE